jgi:CTP synthase (UTP-ammonia lyase)
MQHTVIEFARNVIGFKNVQHEEYNQNSAELIISKLQCSLSGKTMELTIMEGTKAFDCYKSYSSIEDYYCSFGINPEFKSKLNHDDFRISGVDQDNEIRIIEIPKNDFFMATLFVPQSRGTKEKPHPIIKMFIEESIKRGRAE